MIVCMRNEIYAYFVIGIFFSNGTSASSLFICLLLFKGVLLFVKRLDVLPSSILSNANYKSLFTIEIKWNEK